VRWRRWDRIVEPQRIGDWAVSHAAVPFVRHADDGSLELFFSPRDAQGRSHTARAQLSLSDRGARVVASELPVLRPGRLGAFDDSGAMGACLVRHAGRERLYYIGWNRGVTVPFATFIGCASSDDGGQTFERVSPAPVVGRSDADPFLATSPWVLVEDARWRMWYASGVDWRATEEGPRHEYRIVYAESSDGVEWRPTGDVCIDFASESEYAIARPCVIRDSDRYRMWFSHRGPSYSIGYAESDDGIVWERDDERGGLCPAGDGWESQSVEYPCVFDHGGRRWMLYNGNGYGATGIGLAVLEETS
jgi:hypothetical protein